MASEAINEIKLPIDSLKNFNRNTNHENYISLYVQSHDLKNAKNCLSTPVNSYKKKY